MGRTKRTLICPKCRTANPNWNGRIIDGCKKCFYRFPEDKQALQIHKLNKEIARFLGFRDGINWVTKGGGE